MAGQVVFLVPLKHPDNADDYARAWQLLQHTLYSACRQTTDSIRVIVVCNRPLPLDPRLSPEQVIVLTTERPPTPDGHPMVAGKDNPVYVMHQTDKAAKRLLAVDYARKHLRPTHYFHLDADDYLADDLAEMLLTRPFSLPMLAVNRGIIFDIQTRRYIAVDVFSNLCGSCMAIRADWLHARLDQDRGAAGVLLGKHGIHMAGEQASIEYLNDGPLYAAYCQHGDNYARNLWGYAAAANRGALLTPALESRFAIPGAL